MNYILFDDKNRENLLPFTFTRPVCEIRVGILTITEKWEKYLSQKVTFITEDYLSCKYPLRVEQDNIIINGAILPNNEILNEINNLQKGEILLSNNNIIACRGDESIYIDLKFNKIELLKQKVCNSNFVQIEYPWHIFSFNDIAIKDDFKLITNGRTSAPISATNRVMGAENIFLEDGAIAECAILNATTGPIYIGKDAEVMEGSIVRGALAMCEHSALKLGTKIYGATTIGPHSKVGGEINNSVIFGFSNKAHDGFLGNSVLGEWCNLGADTNNSNLKNNYAEVRIWNYPTERFVATGLQFCGLMMGDHSKSGINTMFNTGTVVGVSSNIFGDGFPRNFIPSFSWGGAAKFETFGIKKAYEVAEMAMKRRGLPLTNDDKAILQHVFELDEKYRRF